MTEKDNTIRLYSQIIDGMKGHTYYIQDEDGALRRWFPPSRPIPDHPTAKNGQLSFAELRRANNRRQAEWPGSDQADTAFRALEVAGEFGEVAEAVKKYLRGQRGIKGSTATIENIADEMADAIIALDLLANDLGIDLGPAIVRKFDETSEKYGLSKLN